MVDTKGHAVVEPVLTPVQTIDHKKATTSFSLCEPKVGLAITCCWSKNLAGTSIASCGPDSAAVAYPTHNYLFDAG